MTADASWVDSLLVVSRNADLSDPIFSLPLSRVSSAPVSVPVAILPLVTNTTYYAQLRATNSFDVAGESGIATFTTQAPGAPAGTALFRERGFSTLSATATATDFGTGAESATMRLEASADGFATVVSSTEIAAMLGETATFTAENLTPGTDYALRVRIRNDWGIDTYIELPSAYTRTVPFATTGIGWTFSPDGSAVDFSFGVSGVFAGATGTAALEYDGRTVSSQPT